MDAIAGFFSLVGVMFIARPSFLFGAQSNTISDVLILPEDMAMSGIVESQDQSFPNATIRLNMNPSFKLSGELLNATLNSTMGNNSTLIVTEPLGMSDELLRLSGLISGILGAIFVASAFVAIRKLSNKAHSYHVVSYFHWVAVPFALLLAPCLPSWLEPLPWILPSQLRTWILIMITTMAGVAGQLLLSKALQTEKASKAASMNYFQVVFAFLAEWLFWGVIPNGMSILGASIVIGCTIAVAMFKIKK